MHRDENTLKCWFSAFKYIGVKLLGLTACLLQRSIYSKTSNFSKCSCRQTDKGNVVLLKLIITSQCSVKHARISFSHLLCCFAFLLAFLPLCVSVAEGETLMMLITRRQCSEGWQAVDFGDKK